MKANDTKKSFHHDAFINKLNRFSRNITLLPAFPLECRFGGTLFLRSRGRYPLPYEKKENCRSPFLLFIKQPASLQMPVLHGRHPQG